MANDQLESDQRRTGGVSGEPAFRDSAFGHSALNHAVMRNAGASFNFQRART